MTKNVTTISNAAYALLAGLLLQHASAYADEPASAHHYDVLVSAGAARGDGSTGAIEVRIYSEYEGRFSEWRALPGLRDGETRTLTFVQSSSFLLITRIEARTRTADHARLGVELVDRTGTITYAPAYASVGTKGHVFEADSYALDGEHEVDWCLDDPWCNLQLFADCLDEGLGVCCIHGGVECACSDDSICE